MTDPFELKRAAEQLRHQYAELNQLKHTPPRTPLARKMKPTFGPQTCSPDGDFALNLELLLVDEGDDDNPNHEAPSGLFNMVIDAQRYIHNHTIQTKDGHRLTTFITHHAGAIANQFPAADDLLTLLRNQTQYIQGAIRRRHGTPTNHRGGGTVRLLTATEAAKQLQARGHPTTPDTIRGWARRGHITPIPLPNGRNGYTLNQLQQHIDKQKPTRY